MSELPAGQLHRHAELLRESPLFTHFSSDPLYYKQLLFLVAAGEKPLSIAYSGRFVHHNNQRRWIPDTPAEVATLLRSLDLSFYLYIEDMSITAVTAQDPQMLHRYSARMDSEELGTLLGYPATAAAAFATKTCVSLQKQHAIEAQAGVASSTTFRFLVNHWQEELEVALRRHKLLVDYDLIDAESSSLECQ